MAEQDLHSTAKALVAEGKGILAADESDGTIKKRFDSIGLESTEDEPARVPRPALHDARRGGVHQRRHPLRRDDPPERARRDAVPGAPRVEGHHPRDQGRRGREAARARRGRDGHRGSRRAPRAAGGVPRARRALREVARDVLDLRRRSRATYCIWTNAHALARYAALCQEAGHRADRRAGGAAGRRRTRSSASYHVDVPRRSTPLYTELFDQRVDLRGTLLKPNMVLSGYAASDRAGAEEVAERTLECFYKHVPAAVPGIVFLSGGQTDEDATAHLNAMNAKGPHPWQLSFSYGRALQAPAIKAWGGKPENVEAGAARVLPPREDEQRRADGHVRARMEQEAARLGVLEAGQRGQFEATGPVALRISADAWPRAAHRARARAHDDRVAWSLRPGVYCTPVEERPVRHAGRGDEDVLAGDEIVRVQHPLRVEAGVEQLPALVVVARPEACPGCRRRRTSAPRRR